MVDDLREYTEVNDLRTIFFDPAMEQGWGEDERGNIAHPPPTSPQTGIVVHMCKDDIMIVRPDEEEPRSDNTPILLSVGRAAVIAIV